MRSGTICKGIKHTLRIALLLLEFYARRTLYDQEQLARYHTYPPHSASLVGVLCEENFIPSGAICKVSNILSA